MPQTPPPSSGDSSSSDSTTPANSTRDLPLPRERKGGLACAECRRSKLKCDRVVPCQACVRRGCAQLCPNGVMNATKGNKALQAHAQKLGEQVTNMTAKIKELESALAAAHLQLRSGNYQSEYSRERNFQNSLSCKRRPYGGSPGSLAIDQDGVSRYYGDTASSEYFTGLIPGTGLSSIHHLPDLRQLSLPTELIELFNSFPFGLRDRPHNKSHFLPFIPPRERALQLAEHYWQSFAWMFNPITRHDFQMDIFDRIYGYGEVPCLNYIHPHKLAVFFAVMALGVMRIATADTMQAERYHVLSCAALSLVPVISEAMCATIQALFLINAFLFTTVRVASEESWLLVGLCGRLSYRIGLHRDGTHFNLSRDELQRRRVIFWELYTWDAWLSFVTGRAPAIHLSNTDTKFPDEENDSGIMGYHAWKFRYSAACLWPTVKTALGEAVSYQTIIELDHKIRTFPIPIELQPPLQGYQLRTWSDDPASALQQFCFICERELNLLFLHRNYFAEAIDTAPENPLTHEFGQSVMAAYRSAVRMCVTLRDLYRVHPVWVSRIWYFWSGVFSSCIVLAAIVIKSPGCSIGQNALAELVTACNLFEEGSQPCRHPKAWYILQGLLRRAEETFSTYWESPDDHKLICAIHRATGQPDELCILGGLENVIQHPPRSLSESPMQTMPSRISDIRTQPVHVTPVANAGPRRREKHTYSQPGMAPLHSPQDFDFSGFSNDYGFAAFANQGGQPTLPTYEQVMGAGPSMYASPASESPLNYGSAGPTPAGGYADDFGPYSQGNGSPELFAGEGGSENAWQSFWLPADLYHRWIHGFEMSFFGFDQSNDLEDEKRKFLEGGLKGAQQENVAVYTWGEESYDGLGDALQERGDELNDETFGGTGEVGKDFDFSRQTLPTEGLAERASPLDQLQTGHQLHAQEQQRAQEQSRPQQHAAARRADLNAGQLNANGTTVESFHTLLAYLYV
ncbi:hypothetical protein NM688_g8153 [Phlebia brevispora]|uniref:Uncharacterized protein n=1 Tax=Phlebia brevispora TaxID=194682 RepID=A0ACC1RWP6_9APHY|nr:hypothetical protein NM688_g8153 [Phlebia brevispora]